ncbi:hypothetical protein CRENBAI_020294 [Crenichthys baileyi]|uniref:Uncharacterized protein n=1 Tax=Crenichthys baileyi TaxID=28760 RepID=A0AAV9SD27_9TELE
MDLKRSFDQNSNWKTHLHFRVCLTTPPSSPPINQLLVRIPLQPIIPPGFALKDLHMQNLLLFRWASTLLPPIRLQSPLDFLISSGLHSTTNLNRMIPPTTDPADKQKADALDRWVQRQKEEAMRNLPKDLEVLPSPLLLERWSAKRFSAVLRLLPWLRTLVRQ